MTLSRNHHQEMLLIITESLEGSFADGLDYCSALKKLGLRLSYIPPQSVAITSELYGVARPEIFTKIESMEIGMRPPGDHKLYVCMAENCCQKGANDLSSWLLQSLGIPFFQTTANSAIRVEPFYCLGNCAAGPNVMFDDRLIGQIDIGKLESLLSRAGVDLPSSGSYE